MQSVVKKFGYAAVVVLMALALMGQQGCERDPNRKQAMAEQQSTMSKARASTPTPQVDNFLTRKYVARWMERMDTPSKMFYVYVMTITGEMVGYFTAQYRPVSTCALLTPSEQVVDRHNGDVVVQAPALDGVYYGNSGCDTSFFFTADTDAYVELQNSMTLVLDQPLALNIKHLSVEKQ